MELDKTITQKQFMIVMIMLIVWLSFSIGAFIYFKNQCNMAKESPTSYVVEKYDLSSCTCFTNEGDNFFFNSTNAWLQTKPKTQLNFSIGKN